MDRNIYINIDIKSKTHNTHNFIKVSNMDTGIESKHKQSVMITNENHFHKPQEELNKDLTISSMDLKSTSQHRDNSINSNKGEVPVAKSIYFTTNKSVSRRILTNPISIDNKMLSNPK